MSAMDDVIWCLWCFFFIVSLCFQIIESSKSNQQFWWSFQTIYTPNMRVLIFDIPMENIPYEIWPFYSGINHVRWSFTNAHLYCRGNLCVFMRVSKRGRLCVFVQSMFRLWYRLNHEPDESSDGSFCLHVSLHFRIQVSCIPSDTAIIGCIQKTCIEPFFEIIYQSFLLELHVRTNYSEFIYLWNFYLHQSCAVIWCDQNVKTNTQDDKLLYIVFSSIFFFFFLKHYVRECTFNGFIYFLWKVNGVSAHMQHSSCIFLLFTVWIITCFWAHKWNISNICFRIWNW